MRGGNLRGKERKREREREGIINEMGMYTCVCVLCFCVLCVSVCLLVGVAVIYHLFYVSYVQPCHYICLSILLSIRPSLSSFLYRHKDRLRQSQSTNPIIEATAFNVVAVSPVSPMERHATPPQHYDKRMQPYDVVPQRPQQCHTSASEMAPQEYSQAVAANPSNEKPFHLIVEEVRMSLSFPVGTTPSDVVKMALLSFGIASSGIIKVDLLTVAEQLCIRTTLS